MVNWQGRQEETRGFKAWASQSQKIRKILICAVEQGLLDRLILQYTE